MTTYTPGMRLNIRDEEFSLLHAESTMLGFVLTCLGVSETVAGKEWQFLSDLEKPEVLKPENTRLVADSSPHFRDSLLYLETHLRSRVTTGSQVVRGHQAAMDLMDYQLEPARMALAQTRARILVADTVGLGKTLEAGILVTELMARGRGKRILVVTVKSMLTQFQKEFWNRFTIPLVRMDSQGLARVRSQIPRNHNPFDSIEKAIISIDTLKNENEYRVYLEKAYWDIIIIDEAQHVSFKGTRTLSHRLAGLLGNRSDTLILLSATPHNGKPESFASLMTMLDPTSIADAKNYAKDDIRGLFIRRFRKDVADQIRGGLPEREVLTWDGAATESEEAAYRCLNAIRFAYLDKGQTAAQVSGGQMLKSVSLKKALLSSPVACVAQIDNMMQTLSESKDPAAEGDRAQLAELRKAVDGIQDEHFSKYHSLLMLLKQQWNWKGNDTKDRLVIFTERKKTMEFLLTHLTDDLKLPPGAVKKLDGGMPDTVIQSIVEEFGKERSPLRLLIATDVASEGLNLHYQSHRLVHFDIPWSLMVFQQRNGRIDRYGQNNTPLIAYLLTRYQADVMGGDVRVLEILIAKEMAAWKNIGDPATLMGQFDPEKEELYTADLLLDPDRRKEFEATPVAEADTGSFLDALMDSWTPGGVDRPPAVQAPLALFSDYYFLKAGLETLYPSSDFDLKILENPAQRALSFDVPDDLEAHLKEVLPREIRPSFDRLELVGDSAAMLAKIRHSQAQESTWPEADFLWSNHPVFLWLMDRLKARRGRMQAPVIRLGARLDGTAYLISSTHPNRRGRPVYQRLWACVLSKGNWQVVDGTPWLKSLNLDTTPLVNDGQERDSSGLQGNLAMAVSKAVESGATDFEAYRKAQVAEMAQKLGQMNAKRTARISQLELGIESTNLPQQLKDAKLREERERVNKTFDSWQSWVADTMTLEEKPYVQVLVVFDGGGNL